MENITRLVSGGLAGRSTILFPKIVENVAAAAELLDALANPVRLHIVILLAQGDLSVGVLTDKIGLSQSVLSQHLAKLRKRELVTTRRDAQTIFYKCENTSVLRILSSLSSLKHEANRSDIAPPN